MKAVATSLLALGLVAAVGSSASAQTVSSYQSPYRPWSTSTVPLVGNVYLSGTDTLSAAFNQNLNSYVAMVKQYLPETVAFTGIGLNQLNPQSLYFQFAYAPRVYFIYEGACYTDALGCTIATVSAPTNDPPMSSSTSSSYLLFPNQHYSLSWICATGSGQRSLAEPLAPGDFVQLPTVQAGQQLAFFIGSNLNTSGSSSSSSSSSSNSSKDNQSVWNSYSQSFGGFSNGGWGNSNSNSSSSSSSSSSSGTSAPPANTFYNGAANNVDNFPHMIAFFPDNSQYIIIGFEDLLGGGDQDCNDLMFAVDVGPNNAAAWRAASTTMPQ